MSIKKLFPVSLKGEEALELENYTGIKCTTFDNKGNVVEHVDTRTLRGEQLKAKVDAKIRTRETLIAKFPLNKQLNFNSLPPEEQEYYAKIKEDALKEYELRKELINSATTPEEALAAGNKPKKLVKKANWVTLGLTSEYVLEDEDVE